jgi:hypothetical protein
MVGLHPAHLMCGEIYRLHSKLATGGMHSREAVLVLCQYAKGLCGVPLLLLVVMTETAGLESPLALGNCYLQSVTLCLGTGMINRQVLLLPVHNCKQSWRTVCWLDHLARGCP